ncbi:helicase C-terminal domain-containing protein [Micromonospora profundi]
MQGDITPAAAHPENRRCAVRDASGTGSMTWLGNVIRRLGDFDELDELAHAYAMTIHRSQGSEYLTRIHPVATTT